ncbi:stage V sporulation protein B [Alteribacillus sp. HJP-4]|uniref:stage V sporulation protein B n=1 Tax=Alteribacillus sp. HJP-4 TaxID=2775394 RepID=UPI0035CCE9CA
MKKQTFLQGTIILIIAGLITRVLGFVNKIVTARLLGAEGVGLYMMAFPTLLLIITLTQLGLPVAISKLIAEAEFKKDYVRMKKILVVSMTITMSLSVLFTTGFIAAAPKISGFLLTDERAYYPMLAILPIIPITAASAVLRGYFQGRQNMTPPAVSQVLEQTVRISLVAVFITILMPYGLHIAAAGAMLSVITGELISLLFMFWQFKRKKTLKVRDNFFGFLKSGRSVFHDLMAISLPATGSRLIGSISLFFEPIIIAQSLALAGVATAVATSQYGQLSGFVIPLLFLPTFITYSFSVSLVPSVSEAAASKRFGIIQKRLKQTLRTAILSGGFAAIFLFVFAKEIMVVMYEAPEAAALVRILAPFSIFLYVQGPLQAVLQGLNLAKAAMYNTFIGAITKAGLIFIFASSPFFGIKGAAIAVAVNMMLVTLLHFITVSKAVGFTMECKYNLISLILAAVSVFTADFTRKLLFTDFNLVFQVSAAALFSACIYSLLLLGSGTIKYTQIKKLLQR